MLYVLSWNIQVIYSLLYLLSGFCSILCTKLRRILGNMPPPMCLYVPLSYKSHNLENCPRIVNASSPAESRHIPMGPTFRGIPPPPPYVCVIIEFYAQ